MLTRDPDDPLEELPAHHALGVVRDNDRMDGRGGLTDAVEDLSLISPETRVLSSRS